MLHKMTEEQWDEVVDIHLKGPFLCTQAVSKYMMEKKQGKIINVTSVAGLVGTKGQINYSAAKGRNPFFNQIGGQGISTLRNHRECDLPGIVSTDMTEKIRTDPEASGDLRGAHPGGRFAEP